MVLFSVVSGLSCESKRATEYACFNPDFFKLLDDFVSEDDLMLLRLIDTDSPTFYTSANDIKAFIKELDLIINNDYFSRIRPFLYECVVLCKLCLWGEGKYAIEITPFGLPKSRYPDVGPYQFCLPDIELTTKDNYKG